MKAVFILVTLSLLITACGPSREQITATVVVAQAETRAAAPTLPPAPAPTSTQTGTNTPAAPPTLTQTVTPLPTPTFTPTATNTPVPTLTLRPSPPATQPPPTRPAPSDTPVLTDPDASPRQPRVNIVPHARTARRDVTYCTVDNVELKMDIYFPKSATGVTPLVIFVHGGGWSKGDKSGGEGMTDIPALLDAGFAVASLNYRLAPVYKFPAMIQDVKCAIRSFRAHANDYKIDPAKIGVWGSSAGAHLVNLLGTTDSSAGFDVGEYLDQSSRVRAVVDMFGPADLTVDFSKAFVEARNNAFVGYDLVKASPVTYITPEDPPFLILQGDVDQVVPLSQSQEFYDKLTAAHVPVQLVVVRDGPHGLASPKESPSRDVLTTMIVKFFEQHLK